MYAFAADCSCRKRGGASSREVKSLEIGGRVDFLGAVVVVVAVVVEGEVPEVVEEKEVEDGLGLGLGGRRKMAAVVWIPGGRGSV